jgi:hypothetical protein
MSVLLNHFDLKQIKQAVLMEYTPVSEWSEDSSLAVLIQHKDSFEWMDISHAIPAGSEKEYPPPNEAKIATLKSKP